MSEVTVFLKKYAFFLILISEFQYPKQKLFYSILFILTIL